MRCILAVAAIIVLVIPGAAQLSLGAGAYASLNSRMTDPSYGAGLRAERTLDGRWRMITVLASSVPRIKKVDEVIGGPRQLSVGPSMPTSFIGRTVDMEHTGGLGVMADLGHHNKRWWQGYVGTYLLLRGETLGWNLDATVIATGEQYRSRGSNTVWAVAVAPTFGIRAVHDKGCAFVELAPVVMRTLEQASVSMNYMISAGYCWTL